MRRRPLFFVLHGHFYQPPREDPWFETIPRQPSALPFHDWNARVEQECYRAVIAARLPGDDGRITRIVNTLAWISFDFGPTLLSWLEREAPRTYRGVLEGDRLSRVRLRGHGGAIAQPFHHTILPLASRREKVTEVRWGIADFRRRFGREPAGMWLPEAAVDDETLDVLAQEGVAFTVLAPRQVERAPEGGLPGLYRTRAGGREIALFVYDGGLSHDVAFGGLLQDAHAWADRVVDGSNGTGEVTLVSMATDGETFGHHHGFGEMALAALIDGLERRGDVGLENFESFLARHPAREPVTLVEPSSWSCDHGVERWRSHCGCRVGEEATSQEWRRPLRSAMDNLAEGLHAVFEREGAALLSDPWEARDAYGAVASTIGTERFAPSLDGFLEIHAREALAGESRVRTLELLELERNALRLFTSCGWFFDDVAGIEAVQLLRYAARAIELSGQAAGRLEEAFMADLARVLSNDVAAGDGACLYAEVALPALPADVGAAAALTMSGAIGASQVDSIGAYGGVAQEGHVSVTHSITGCTSEFRADVRRSVGNSIEVAIRAATGGDVWRLSPLDLPDPGLDRLGRGLSQVVIERWLGEEESWRFREGSESLQQAVVQALERTIGDLASRRRSATASRLEDLLDWLDVMGVQAPFDAQTAFWEAWEGASGKSEREVLRPLGRRLGFACKEAG
ncbi:MAG: DUF3536 domain-containing protein [Gemmatimonadota bacterium]|nr:MAG: DUF3536 domain-containing protein [Gemmatimonadota bacterium]